MARKHISKEPPSEKNINTKYTIEFVNKVAKERGGLCLSTEYQNGQALLDFECEFGHRWPARFDPIKNRAHWCPYCAGSYGEEFCRQIMQIAIGCTFLRGRPEWLISPDGFQMEYDGYSEDRSVAFEYHGLHHYLEPHGNRKEKPLSKVQARDQAKIEQSNGRVILLVFRQIPECSAQEEYIEYALSIVKSSGIQTVCTDVAEIMDKISMPEDAAFLKLKAKMAEQNCTCLSKNYVGERVKIDAKCNCCGREWAVIPKSFSNGRGCTACKSSQRHAAAREIRYAEALAAGITLKPYKKRIFKKKAK